MSNGTHLPHYRVRTAGVGLTALATVFLLSACGGALRTTGLRLLHREAPEPAQVLRDVPYRLFSDDPKHRLDLFLPAGEGWPVLVFIHGGGWDQGDKDLSFDGVDVYGNLGRFYADRGIGVANVNYRLQFEATWRDQVDDVAHALAWTRANVGRYGGDPGSLFLAGHSAGAQLAAYVALDRDLLASVGLAPDDLCGVVPVSGAAFDMTDERTYELGADVDYLERRFRIDPEDGDWQRAASAVTHLSSEAPPFLLLHGSLEWRSLAHQNRLLDQALRAEGVPSELVVVPQLHQTIVLALARDNSRPAEEVLSFVGERECRL